MSKKRQQNKIHGACDPPSPSSSFTSTSTSSSMNWKKITQRKKKNEMSVSARKKIWENSTLNHPVKEAKQKKINFQHYPTTILILYYTHRHKQSWNGWQKIKMIMMMMMLLSLVVVYFHPHTIIIFIFFFFWLSIIIWLAQ